VAFDVWGDPGTLQHPEAYYEQLRRNQKSYPQINPDYRRLEIRSFLICVYLRKSADEKQLRENVVRKTRKRSKATLLPHFPRVRENSENKKPLKR
jgi:hypothetical protein